MAGRRPKPTALKKLEGNPGKRPLNEREPILPPAVLRCPRHLEPEARKEWRRVVHELNAAGLLTRVDRAALAAYCQLYARWIAAEKEIQADGLILTTAKGGVMQNPAVRIAATSLDGMRKYLVELGMTPSSRSRLKVAPPKKEKSLEEMLADAMSGMPPLEVEDHACN
jgi:P27 family predicted phage terminase small subunit